MTFITNAWYVAAFCDEVSAELTSRTLLAQGDPHALDAPRNA